MAKWSFEEAYDHMVRAGGLRSGAGYDLSEHMEDVDNVNNPSHYTYGNIECIDYLRDNMPYEAFLGFLEGNAKKYMHRWRHKGKPLEDLSKSRWYLNLLIKELGGDEGA